MGKPTAEHASIMRDLFPSSSASKRPRLTSSFDPTQNCVALPQHQKKKASRCKPSKLTVIIVEDYTKGVPRASYRKELQKSGRILKLEFNRSMSARQVQGVILRGFLHIQVSRVTFLKCSEGKSSILVPDDNQDQDGFSLIEGRKGVIYVTDSQVNTHDYLCHLN